MQQHERARKCFQYVTVVAVLKIELYSDSAPPLRHVVVCADSNASVNLASGSSTYSS
jgi:hypothetical protein